MKEIQKWYADKISKTPEEFDAIDKHIETVIQTWEKEREQVLNIGGVNIMFSEIEENAENWGSSKEEDGEERFYGYHYDTAFNSFIEGAKWMAERLKKN